MAVEKVGDHAPNGVMMVRPAFPHLRVHDDELTEEVEGQPEALDLGFGLGGGFLGRVLALVGEGGRTR